MWNSELMRAYALPTLHGNSVVQKGGCFESSYMRGCVVLRPIKMVQGGGVEGRGNYTSLNLHCSNTFKFTELHISLFMKSQHTLLQKKAFIMYIEINSINDLLFIF